jgi:uncharacterized damage-inducible protein DinB
MTNSESLIAEFEREAQTTRKHLERLPGDQLEWRPHEKSFAAGALAAHMVDCIAWADVIFNQDELDFDPATYKFCRATSVAELLKTFDEKVNGCRQAMERVNDADLQRPWRFTMMGRVRFEKPRAAVYRDFTLSHLIHHRGQFSLYLRLLNVPVPGSYGPSADEQNL